jgi:phytanoyl-CoA hydroxylase
MTVAAIEPENRQINNHADRFHVTAAQYTAFRRDGVVVVPQLVAPHGIEELRQHTEDLMQGRLPEQQSTRSEFRSSSAGVVTVNELGAPPEHLSREEKAQFFLRIHMLHRKLELHERYLLHPRVLDALQVLIGPDVLALQTMLFLKPPGKPGQGWHQDSYYIPTHPDTLCGAWIAIDECDEYNGAMWFAKGSGHEPVYPPCPDIVRYGFGDKLVRDITYVKGVSDPVDENNMLSRVADRYDQVLICAKPGDVVFFNGHVLHRSKKNATTDRFRRAFVSHYCNARSFTQWGADKAKPEGLDGVPPIDPTTNMTNGSHILARGDTHLPFARPRFGTPCAAVLPEEQRRAEYDYAARIIAETGDGLLGCAIADPNVEHDHKDEKSAADSGGY